MDIVDRLYAYHQHFMHTAMGPENVKVFEEASNEIKQLRAEIVRLKTHLNEADELLRIAHYAHQKMGLEGEGSRGHSHEVRMFALHFSREEIPKSPEHTLLSGSGRFWKYWTRDK